MLHWHANVKKNSMAGLVLENLQEHMPRVRIDIVLQKVVKAAVATDLTSISALLLQVVECLDNECILESMLHLPRAQIQRGGLSLGLWLPGH